MVFARNVQTVAATAPPPKAPPPVPVVHPLPVRWGPVVGHPTLMAFHPAVAIATVKVAAAPSAGKPMISGPVHAAMISAIAPPLMSVRKAQQVNTAILRLQAVGAQKIVLPPPKTAGPPPIAKPPDSTDIYVLALICRPVPRCPDPDPALSW